MRSHSSFKCNIFMIIEDKAKKTMWAHQTKDFTKKKTRRKKI